MAGTVPSELGFLTVLEVLDLGKSLLESLSHHTLVLGGYFWLNHYSPWAWCVTYAAGNRLTSTLPTEFGLLTALMTLYLGK